VEYFADSAESWILVLIARIQVVNFIFFTSISARFSINLYV
jgi:hypothetical protein